MSSHDHYAAQRAADLKALPRIGTSQITTPAQFVRRLEDIAFEVGHLLETARKANDPHWWRFADLLDDVMDVVDVVQSAGLPTEEPAQQMAISHPQLAECSRGPRRFVGPLRPEPLAGEN